LFSITQSKNLFLSKRGVKLGDLGVARALSQSAELASTVVGTPYYLAPEVRAAVRDRRTPTNQPPPKPETAPIYDGIRPHDS